MITFDDLPPYNLSYDLSWNMVENARAGRLHRLQTIPYPLFQCPGTFGLLVSDKLLLLFVNLPFSRNQIHLVQWDHRRAMIPLITAPEQHKCWQSNVGRHERIRGERYKRIESWRTITCLERRKMKKKIDELLPLKRVIIAVEINANQEPNGCKGALYGSESREMP